MLNFVFIDPIDWDYGVETPWQRPIGGSQSALCYLAVELAKRGHGVSLINRTTQPGVRLGVTHAPLTHIPVPVLQAADIYIVLNGCFLEAFEQIDRHSKPGTPHILWTQHAHDQPAVQLLTDPAVRDFWDGFVLISHWQQQCYERAFGVDKRRVQILHNAVAPHFQGLFDGPVAAAKAWPPVLCYTSTPYRGLDRLLLAFPQIRAAIPGTRLRVFSSMKVYFKGDEEADKDDPCRDFYDLCRRMEGVDYVGSVPQPELADALRHATALAYPNSYAETSCIAVMEAMAAGCEVVTSDLGALRETCAGFGHLVPALGHPGLHADQFARRMIEVLTEHRRDQAATEQRLAAQVAYANTETTWAHRARQWEDWVSAFIARR